MNLKVGDSVRVVTSAGPFLFLPLVLGEVEAIDRSMIRLKFPGHRTLWWELRDGSLHFNSRHTIRVAGV